MFGFVVASVVVLSHADCWLFLQEELCYGDLECPLKIKVFDHEGSGRHREIGGFETNVRSLIERVSRRGNADREQAFQIFKEDPDARPGVELKNAGLVVVVQADLVLEQ